MKIVSAFPDPIPVASSVDFPTFFDKVINEYESNIALIDQEANISYKFSELRFLINRFSIFLEKLPLKQGDIVATLLGNSAEFIALFLACCKQRLVFTPLNPNYHRREIETYLLKVSPQYLIVEDNLYNESAYLPSIVKSINSVYRINELMLFTSPTGERDGNYELEPFDNSATAVIFFSSGTSGFPKPTKISHKALITQINIVRCIEENAIQDFLVLGCSDVSYGVMPYCHSGGLMATLMMIAQGAKVLINRKFNEDSFYQHIEKYKVTTLTLVPAVMCLFLNSEKTKNYDLTSIKNIFFGSSNIHVDVLDRLKKKFTHITNYIHLYGLTEANIVFMMPNIEAAKKKITSVGVLMPGVQCRIISISPNDLDSDVETLEEGELYIKSDMVMNGYLNEEDNANAFDEGNWLKTGDIVSVDRDGFFYIKGIVYSHEK
uniref:AMP-binding domain-containing protein n=1 Tax=Rhabditophanes sp. KR3021 TaxID=114890 RepID=A0AC35U0Q5_9BILA